jgi:tellurite resistance protein TerC
MSAFALSAPVLAATESGSRSNFVDLDVPVWAWVALAVTLAVMLAVDLIRHRDDHEPTPREAAIETMVWISFGLAFSVVIAIGFGSGAFGEYISGYLIEKSLSVDNVFVWAILFSSMAIPLKYQHRVLFWGIFGALALRLVFIFVGSALISRFFWLLIVFGLFLVYTGFKIIRHRADEGEGAKTTGLGLLKRIMPVTDELDGHKFFTKVGLKRAATPLLAALVVIEITDVIFALDSVPAVLAVSNEPFIVFASNAFAILGLRAMYFLLANARQRFHYLSHALGGILIFVGLKMTASHWYHVNTYLSLGLICAMLVAAVIFSERKNRALALSGAAPLETHNH